jgi:hypothetical protein
VLPVRTVGFEFGNLGADVITPLGEQIVTRDFVLRPPGGVRMKGSKILYGTLDDHQFGMEPVEFRDPIHWFSPESKGANEAQNSGETLAQ